MRTGPAVLALLLASGPARTEEAPPAAALVRDPAVREASGLAVARRRTETLWSHNDSGYTPDLHAVSFDGDYLGAVRVEGAENVDWEDLAAFEHEGRPFLLIGDVGDNQARRREVSLIAAPEPGWMEDGRPEPKVRPAWTVRFRYPDGPRDAESVAVDGERGQVLILSKRDRVPRLYAVPLRPEDPDRLHTATFLGESRGLPRPAGLNLAARIAAQPTAMDFTPDGQSLVVLTYGDAFRFQWREGDRSWADPLAREPERIPLPSPALGILPQREGLAVDAEGRTVFVISEGTPAQMLRVPLPSDPDPSSEPSSGTANEPSAALRRNPLDHRGHRGYGGSQRGAVGWQIILDPAVDGHAYAQAASEQQLAHENGRTQWVRAEEWP